MKVWILHIRTYYRLSVYRTEKKAGDGAIESMDRWFDDLEDRFLSSDIRCEIDKP